MKKLQRILDKVNEVIIEEMAEALKNGEKHVLKLVDITEDIQVDVEITDEVAEVYVSNLKNLEIYYPNIEARIIENLPTWDEISNGTIREIYWRQGA